MNPLTIDIYRQAQSPPNFLALFHLARRFVQRTNCKHIRVIPTLAQRRMTEDKSQWLVRIKQPLLVFHNQVVCAIIIFCPATFALSVTRVLPLPDFVFGKIAIVHHLDRQPV